VRTWQLQETEMLLMLQKNQWVKLPNDWPFPRILFGNISAIKTQITAPVEKAKNII